jgi:hypothetical protein
VPAVEPYADAHDVFAVILEKPALPSADFKADVEQAEAFAQRKPCPEAQQVFVGILARKLREPEAGALADRFPVFWRK